MTMVFAFKFSDYEYFTNKCMSVGIFNQINQIIFLLETKRDFSVFQLSVIQSSIEMLNASLKNNDLICLVPILFI